MDPFECGLLVAISVKSNRISSSETWRLRLMPFILSAKPYFLLCHLATCDAALQPTNWSGSWLFLLQRYIIPQFHKGSHEVHVVFDNPGQLQNTPKYFEHQRRDSKQVISGDHICHEFKEGLEYWTAGHAKETSHFYANIFFQNSSPQLISNQALYV